MTLQAVYPGYDAERAYEKLRKQTPFKDFCKQAIWEKLDREKKKHGGSDE